MALPDVLVVGKEGNNRFNVFHAEFLGCDDDLERGLEQYDSTGWERICWGRDLIGQARALHEKGRFSEVNDSGLWKDVDLSLSFVGHTIVQRPVIIKNVVYLDTGAYRAYRSKPSTGQDALTICRPKTMDMWQVFVDGTVVRVPKGKSGEASTYAESAREGMPSTNVTASA